MLQLSSFQSLQVWLTVISPLSLVGTEAGLRQDEEDGSNRKRSQCREMAGGFVFCFSSRCCCWGCLWYFLGKQTFPASIQVLLTVLVCSPPLPILDKIKKRILFPSYNPAKLLYFIWGGNKCNQLQFQNEIKEGLFHELVGFFCIWPKTSIISLATEEMARIREKLPN